MTTSNDTSEPTGDAPSRDASSSGDASSSDASAASEASAPLAYATEYHAPVLSREVCEHLITDPSGCYVDATLGGGGHSEAILDALDEGGRVVGIDQDADAIETARERLAGEIEAGRFDTIRDNFRRLKALLEEADLTPVDGVLLDLGVSSHQIDTAQRGFSFQQEGPLDMRMDDRHGITAHQIVNAWGEREIADVIYEFGDERRSRPIARAIVEARPLDTTTDLADAVRSAVPPPDEVKTLARVFQALRIAVNTEMDALERALRQSPDVLKIGGRIAVISYHSLEDRRAKRFLKYGNFEGKPVRDVYGTLITPWDVVTRKPVEASDDEVEANPRARSAHLRVSERQENDAGPPVPN